MQAKTDAIHFTLSMICYKKFKYNNNKANYKHSLLVSFSAVPLPVFQAERTSAKNPFDLKKD